MSTTMDQIHHIRELFYQQDKNISQIASETSLNRKTVSKYVDMEDFNSPPPTLTSEEEHESKLNPFKPLIDEWLQADKLAPRKQRHTAKRIFKRLKDEVAGFNCSYRLVALYVREKKAGLPLKTRKSEPSKPDYRISSDNMDLQRCKISTRHSIPHSMP